MRLDPKRMLTLQKIWFCIFTCFLVLVSCSTDETKDLRLEDAQIPEKENANDNGEPTDTSASGELVFEEDLWLNENRTFVNYVLPDTEYTKFITGEGDIGMVTHKIYEYLNDDFDFIIILSVEETQPAGLFYGKSYSVQNQIQGLGTGTFDNTASYGSAGKLKSIIYMPRTEYIRTGPFLHEIVHTWANKGIIPTTVGGHWGFASTAGQLGGFDELVDLGNDAYKGRLNGQDGFGTFANGGNSLPYGNLELYLMGLIPSSDVGSLQVAFNPEFINTNGEFRADSIETFTIDDLVDEHGERIPSAQDSQKVFRALAVIISTTPISAEKSDAVHINLENFARASTPDSNWGGLNNFWMATQGKASFAFEILQESIK